MIGAGRRGSDGSIVEVVLVWVAEAVAMAVDGVGGVALCARGIRERLWKV